MEEGEMSKANPEPTEGDELQWLVSKHNTELQDPENPLKAWIRTDTNGEDLLDERGYNIL